MKSKIAIIVLVLVIAIIIIWTSVYSIFSLSDSARTNLANDIRTNTKNNANLLDERLVEKLIILENIAESDIVKSMDWQIIRPYIEQYIEPLGTTNIGLSTLCGNTLYALNNEQGNFVDRNYFNLVSQGISNYEFVISRTLGVPVIMFAVPIFNGDEVVGAILSRKMTHRELSFINELPRSWENEHYYVINNDGTIIFHRNRDYMTFSFNVLDAAIRNYSYSSWANNIYSIFTGEKDHSSYRYQNNEYIGHFESIGDSSWYLFLSVDTTPIYELLNNIRSIIVTFGFILIIMIASIIFVIYFLKKNQQSTIIKNRVNILIGSYF